MISRRNLVAWNNLFTAEKKYFAFMWSSAAQHNLFIIIAFLILIFFIIFYFSTKENIEKSIETTDVKNIELKKRFRDIPHLLKISSKYL